MTRSAASFRFLLDIGRFYKPVGNGFVSTVVKQDIKPFPKPDKELKDKAEAFFTIDPSKARSAIGGFTLAFMFFCATLGVMVLAGNVGDGVTNIEITNNCSSQVAVGDSRSTDTLRIDPGQTKKYTQFEPEMMFTYPTDKPKPVNLPLVPLTAVATGYWNHMRAEIGPNCKFIERPTH